jgi:hypothetical protein
MRLRSTPATGGRAPRVRRDGRWSTCGGSVPGTVKLRPACGQQGRTCRGKTMGLHAPKDRRELDHRSRRPRVAIVRPIERSAPSQLSRKASASPALR